MNAPRPAPILAYAALSVIAIIFLMPLAWMFATSIKPESQAVDGSIAFIPRPPAADAPPETWGLGNYQAVWTDPSVAFPVYLRNTLVVASLSVAGMVLSSAVVAYGFSRISWRGRGVMFTVMLATMMIPFPVIMGPLYIIFSKLGWIGSLKPLWVPAWFGGAFNIFMLRQFYMQIPRELDEAARIDGCGHWGIFWRVIMPLSTPALAVVALFHFMYVWNDFLAPLIFLTHRDQFTLALGLQLYQSKAGNTPWNLLMAASVMVTAPVLLLFLLTQRTFVQGISAGGVKE